MRFAFLMLPRYSMLAASCAIEALRHANQILGRRAFEWSIFSAWSDPPPSSSGLQLGPQQPIAAFRGADVILVHASYDAEASATRPVLGFLRRQAALQRLIGGIETGSLVLAKAGLLDGCTATCHWDELESAAARYPAVEFVQDIFVRDGQRLSCAGGTTSLDLMLTLIADAEGRNVSAAVARGFLHSSIRPGADQQVDVLQERLARASPGLRRAMRLAPGLAASGATAADLADASRIGQRQLEKQFRFWLGTTPAAYLRKVRLDRARSLLRGTNLGVLSIAIECGFSSASHFSIAYSAHFGIAPSKDRRAT
jgi:transcriptional regulator GlxA family with amidase domain